MSTVPALRIGDAERDDALTALGEHYAAGRLAKDEYDERAGQVWAARFRGDLVPVFADLPSPRGPLEPQRPLPPSSRRQPQPWRPHPLMWAALPLIWLTPVLMVALVAVVIVTGAPWLLFALFWFCAVSGFGRRHARPAVGSALPARTGRAFSERSP